MPATATGSRSTENGCDRIRAPVSSQTARTGRRRSSTRQRFRWTDADWRGIGRDGHVIYEMHVGTFTAEGTWRAAREQLPALAELGITVIEMMPVADFPGRFGWGYDGVDLYAPTRSLRQRRTISAPSSTARTRSASA